MNEGGKEKDVLHKSDISDSVVILINIRVFEMYMKVLWITMLSLCRINDMTFEEPGCDFQCIYNH